MTEEYREDGGVGGSITASILQEELASQLASKGQKIHAAKPHPIEASDSQVSDDKVIPGAEKLLINLFEARDDLIDVFEDIDIHSKVASVLTNNINKIGSCISSLGGEIKIFDPIDHVSGLQAPDLDEHAERIIKTTEKCYSLGKVSGKIVGDNEIEMIFRGEENNTLFEAIASITAPTMGWLGNEAVDYIYTPGEGRMSVKSFEDGKWIDKSSSYTISWKLNEEPKNIELQKSEENEENEEEDQKEITNNLEGNDFPIEEK